MPLLTPDSQPNLPAEIIIREVETLRPRSFCAGSPGERVQQADDGFRYTAGDTATVDAQWDGVLDILPGRQWNGELPMGVFSTVTALLLAARGRLPIHGSAVEIGGRGILVCGPSGAGKSTLAASLIASGGRLISDDLSVLHPDPAGGPVSIFAGRRTVRLFADVAGLLGDKVPWVVPPVESDGKLAVAPPQVSATLSIALTDVILLTSDNDRDVPNAGARITEDFSDQLFRPRWMRRIPGHTVRLAALAIAARHLRFHRAPFFQVRDADSFQRGAELLLQTLGSA